jgi:hypothetical protein
MRGWVICRLIWISSNSTAKTILRHWAQWNHRFCIIENCLLSLGNSEGDLTPEEFTLRFSFLTLSSVDLLTHSRFASIKSHSYSEGGEHSMIILCQSLINFENVEITFQFKSSEIGIVWQQVGSGQTHESQPVTAN